MCFGTSVTVHKHCRYPWLSGRVTCPGGDAAGTFLAVLTRWGVLGHPQREHPSVISTHTRHSLMGRLGASRAL